MPVKVDKPVAMVPVRYEDQDLPVFSKRRVRIGVRKGDRLTVVTDLPDEVEGPIRRPEDGHGDGPAERANPSPRSRFSPHGPLKAEPDRQVAREPFLDRRAALLLFFAIIASLLLVRRRREKNARKRLQRVLRTRR